MKISISPIGIVHSSYKTKETCPIQGAYYQEALGEIEIFPEYLDGLKDIETFTHLIILYHFNMAGEVKLIRPTFLDDNPHGIFATRHPCRPSEIGLSVVTLLDKMNNILKVGCIDVLDKTPLLDIKPYVPRFDSYPEAREGWATDKPWRPKPPNLE
jgi:tRNA-Thr(GGU) m(6)t(6)A37 methyltransferase TsaA